MSRLTGNDAKGLMEAYAEVYAPQEITEEQIQEHFETWVNILIEEGYDLSEYTWDEMYEVYEQFAPALSSLSFGIPAAAALGGAALLNPDIRRRLQQAGTGLVQKATDLVTGGNRAEKDYQNWLNQPLQSKKNQRRSQNQRDRAAREVDRRGRGSQGRPPQGGRGSQGRPPQGSSSSQPNPANPASRPNPQESPSSSSSSSTSRTARGTRVVTGSQSNPEPPKQEPGAKDLGTVSLRDIGQTPGQPSTSPSSSSSSGGGSPKIDPLQTIKDVGRSISPVIRQTLGKAARERFFGTTRTGQVVRGLGTTGAVGLDVRGKIANPESKSTTSQIGSVGPGTAGNTVRAAGALFGGDKPTSGGIPRGAFETGKDLQRLGQYMLDQPQTKVEPRPVAPPVTIPIPTPPEIKIELPKKKPEERRTNRPPSSLTDSTDLLDIIQGYLISEKYAHDEKAALKIVENMSKEWKIFIINSYFGA